VIITPVQYVDVPTVDTVNITVPKLTTVRDRRAIYNRFSLNNSNTVTLSVTPYNPYWVEVWHNNLRLLNINPQQPRYVISNNVITFIGITTGDITVVIDTEPMPYFAGNIIRVNGVQHDSNSGISLRSEPVALTQPLQGYVRLTGDRKHLVYVPPANFTGKDTFSWTLITQNGQIGAAKCALITVV